MNKSGKTITIFIILCVVILSCSTSIGFFLYHQEKRARKTAEGERDASREAESKLQGQLKEFTNQITLLKDKNKEADEKINNLLDEIELNEGVRDQLKKENATLKTAADNLKVETNDLGSKYQKAQEALSAEEQKQKQYEDQITQLKQQISQQVPAQTVQDDAREKVNEALNLEKIVGDPWFSSNLSPPYE